MALPIRDPLLEAAQHLEQGAHQIRDLMANEHGKPGFSGDLEMIQGAMARVSAAALYAHKSIELAVERLDMRHAEELQKVGGCGE